MGRKHKLGRPPQNDRRQAQREMRRTLQVPFPKAFGIKRPLDPEVSAVIVGGLRGLRREDDIPQGVRLREKLHATLLPQRVFGQQVLKGIIGGYNLRSMNNELNRKTAGSNEETVDAEICGVNIYKGKIINVKLICPEMEEERERIAEVLGALGLKGLRKVKEETVLHMSLGESKQGLTPTEQRHIEHITLEEIDHIRGVELPLPFLPWDIYPNLDYWQQ